MISIKTILKSCFISIFLYACATNGYNTKSALDFRKDVEEEYKNPVESPVANHLNTFPGLMWFAIDPSYVVKAKFKNHQTIN